MPKSPLPKGALRTRRREVLFRARDEDKLVTLAAKLDERPPAAWIRLAALAAAQARVDAATPEEREAAQTALQPRKGRRRT